MTTPPWPQMPHQAEGRLRRRKALLRLIGESHLLFLKLKKKRRRKMRAKTMKKRRRRILRRLRMATMSCRQRRRQKSRRERVLGLLEQKEPGC